MHKGTGIYGEYKQSYEVAPKSKKALKTPYGTFGKVVQQGHKPNPYLDNALDDYISRGGLDRAMKDYADRVLKDIAADVKKAFGKLIK
ncbi:hypothetical protein FACS189487_02710 [Campylobacterota bacterium]|nr:hypothetical protein FACS189487_02710 [Campylobacterota bacterium]